MEVTSEIVSFFFALAIFTFQLHLQPCNSVLLNFRFKKYFAVWQKL